MDTKCLKTHGIDVWAEAAGIGNDSYTDFRFYSPTRERAEKLRPSLKKLGFHVWIQLSRTGPDYMVIATARGVLNPLDYEDRFKKLANKFGADFDGFEVTLKNSSEEEVRRLAAEFAAAKNMPISDGIPAHIAAEAGCEDCAMAFTESGNTSTGSEGCNVIQRLYDLFYRPRATLRKYGIRKSLEDAAFMNSSLNERERNKFVSWLRGLSDEEFCVILLENEIDSLFALDDFELLVADLTPQRRASMTREAIARHVVDTLLPNGLT